MPTNWLTPEPPPSDEETSGSVSSQLFWFAALSFGSLAVVAIVAYALRGLLFL